MKFPDVDIRAWQATVSVKLPEMKSYMKRTLVILSVLIVFLSGYFVGAKYNLVYRDFIIVKDACSGRNVIASRYQVSDVSIIKFSCSENFKNE